VRILVVEDNDSLAALLADSLGKAGFAVDCMATLADAAAAAETARYDAVILDRSLPDGDGLALIGRLRAGGIATPVLILSARDRVEDRIQGLNSGADDYLPKPFALDELTARLNALLRRPAAVLPTCQVVGNVAMDDATQEVEVAGRKVDLTRRERALLRIFIRSNGRLVSRATLEEALFGFNEEVGSNAIDVYIHRLRKRLEAVGATAQVHTERGIGFRFAAGEPGP
jgi:DNA-binding response OmpR family regulator